MHSDDKVAVYPVAWTRLGIRSKNAPMWYIHDPLGVVHFVRQSAGQNIKLIVTVLRAVLWLCRLDR